MIKKRWMNQPPVVLGLLTAVTAFFSSHTAYFLFPSNFNLIILATVFGIFLPFYRFGFHKKQHILYVSGYALLTYLFLIILCVSSALPKFYSMILMTFVFFSCLCTHRYCYGSSGPGIFMVVYALILLLLNPHSAWSELPHLFSTLTVGLLIPYLWLCLLILISPLSEIPISPPNKDLYLIKHAIRITLILDVAFIFSFIFDIVNVTWVCFSILVVSEINIGASVKKALERFLGTLFGGLIGVLIAHLLFKNHIYSLYICFVFIFFAYYFSKKNYTLGITLVTIWVSASFYMLKPHMSVNQFIFSRFIDTTVGIFLGLLGTFFIFPKSIIRTIRYDLSQIFLGFSVIMDDLVEGADAIQINEKITQQKERFFELKRNIKIVNYEPIIHVSKRYAYIKKISSTTKKIHVSVNALVELSPVLDSEKEILIKISQAMFFLKNITPRTHLKEVLLLKRDLESITLFFHPVSNPLRTSLLENIVDDVKKLLQWYVDALSIPYWLPRWKSD